jgi:hypothetical protein
MTPESREWRDLPSSTKSLIRTYQGAVPIDLKGLADALGISVKAATLPPGISGEIRPDPSGSFTIKVSRHDVPGRQRFTVAHEIAHYLLHRHLIGDGIRDDALYRSQLTSTIEAQANRLASDIVMPNAAIDRAARTARALGSENVAALLAEQFRVSEAAMNIKLGG